MYKVDKIDGAAVLGQAAPRSWRTILLRVVKSRSNLSLVSFGSKIATRAGTFLVVAPILGPLNQATLVATATWSATILLLMSFGFQVRVLRQIVVERRRACSVFVSDLRAMAMLFVPSVLIFVVATRYVLEAYDSRIFVIMFLATAITIVIEYCSAVLRGLDHYASEALISFAMSVLMMFCAITIAWWTGSLFLLALGFLACRLVFLAASVGAVLRSDAIQNSRGQPLEPIGRTLLSTSTYFVDGSLSVVLSGIDIMILSKMVAPATLGPYAVGSRLVQLFLVVPWVATNVMVPGLARREGTERFRGEINRLMALMAGTAALGALGLVVGGPLFAWLFLRHRFDGVNAFWPSFAILVLARFFEGAFGIVLTAIGRIKARVFLQFAAVALIFAGSLVLVPVVGPKGVVLMISLAYTALGLCYVYWLKRRGIFYKWWAWLVGAAILAAAVVVAGVT